MDFGYDARTEELRRSLLDLMESTSTRPRRCSTTSSARSTTPGPGPTVPVLEELRAEARARGLWNLFLPASTATEPG